MSKKLPSQRGITRALDKLGRITIPIEMYRSLGIKKGDEVEISTEEDIYGNLCVLVSKSHYNCFACNERLTPASGVQFKTIMLCKSCVAEIAKL